MSIAALYKEAYSGLARSTWWLSLVMLINRSGTMVVPFMTLYLTEARHFGIGKAGFVMAVFGMGAICGGLLGGKLTDRFGFYSVQISALVCGGVLFIVLGQMVNYIAICCTTFLLAMINESFRPANSTAIAHYSKEENRTRSYSLNRLAINLGWAMGGAFGGFIASKNYHLLFWIDGFTNIGAAILLRYVLAPTKNKQTPSKNATRLAVATENSAYKDKVYLLFIALTIIFGYCFFQLFSVMPVFFKQKLHLTPFFIGIVMAMNGLLIALFEMVTIFTLEKKKKNLQFIQLGCVLIGASFLILNLLPGTYFLAIASTLIMTAGEILSMPFMNSFWISRTTAGNRGQYAGLYTIAWSIAQILGPGTGSQMAEHWGFTNLWWLIGGLCILVAAGFWWLQQLTSPQTGMDTK